jgi:hypothetical protein
MRYYKHYKVLTEAKCQSNKFLYQVNWFGDTFDHKYGLVGHVLIGRKLAMFTKLAFGMVGLETAWPYSEPDTIGKSQILELVRWLNNETSFLRPL